MGTCPRLATSCTSAGSCRSPMDDRYGVSIAAKDGGELDESGSAAPESGGVAPIRSFGQGFCQLSRWSA